MAASGRAVRSNSKTTGMNVDADIWQPRDKVKHTKNLNHTFFSQM